MKLVDKLLRLIIRYTYRSLLVVYLPSGTRSSQSVAPYILYEIVVTHQAEKIWLYDRTTVQGATFSMRGQLYHGHYLSHYVMEGRGRR